MRLIGDLSLLVGFVTRTQAALQEAIAPAPVLPAVTPPEEFEREQAATSSQLDQSIREADRRGWKPQQELLRDVRRDVDARELAVPRPDLAERYEREKVRLPAEQQLMPDAYGSALDFLRQSFQAAKADAAPKGDRVATAAETHAPPATPAPAAPPPDPRIKLFVDWMMSDGYQPAASDAALHEKAAPERRGWTALPPEARKFVTTLDARHQAAFADLPKSEQHLFRALAPGERGQYLKMTPAERATYEQLDPSARSAFLLLHPDQRELVRQRAKDGRPVLSTIDARLAELAKTEPGAVTNLVADELVDTLGYAHADDPARRVAMAKAAALLSNHLQERPGNLEYARLATLKDLVAQPEFQDQLMGELENRLWKRDPRLGQHMLALRPQLIEHAEALLKPDTDREALLGALAHTVTISKRLSDAQRARRGEQQPTVFPEQYSGLRA